MIAISIPKERSAILIGKEGGIKALIEKRADVKISVFDGDVSISGDPEKEARVEEIVKAIGRGFPPEIALNLLSEDRVLDVITIKGTSNTIKRLAARIIGTQGKARKNIEKLTGASVAVYGKTVSIIGSYKESEKARTAIEMLIMGRRHSFVWTYLERVKFGELKAKFSKTEIQNESIE